MIQAGIINWADPTLLSKYSPPFYFKYMNQMYEVASSILARRVATRTTQVFLLASRSLPVAAAAVSSTSY